MFVGDVRPTQRFWEVCKQNFDKLHKTNLIIVILIKTQNKQATCFGTQGFNFRLIQDFNRSTSLCETYVCFSTTKHLNSIPSHVIG